MSLRRESGVDVTRTTFAKSVTRSRRSVPLVPPWVFESTRSLSSRGSPQCREWVPQDSRLKGFLHRRKYQVTRPVSLTAGYRSQETRMSTRLPPYNVERARVVGVEPFLHTQCRKKCGLWSSGRLSSYNAERSVGGGRRVPQDPRRSVSF